ncbi:MAG: glycoside hydrolase family 3 N-terminal domain-containing protein [Cytophagales bacterium]
MFTYLKKYKFILCLSISVLDSCVSQKPAVTKTCGEVQKTKDSSAVQVLQIPQLSEEDSLKLKIGQMIMIGDDFKEPIATNDSLLKEIADNKVGGIIVFEKNIAAENSFAKLKNNIDTLQSKSKIPLLISIDEEGGKVHRLKEKYGFVKMPSQMYLGKIDNADSTTFYNSQLAKELKDLGINMNYAPLLDMAVNENNPVIYKLWRSYSANADMVSKHAKLSIMAHNNYNIATVIKHFPGHGSSNTDSHLGLTDVSKTWSAEELKPFITLIQDGSAQVVMTAHIVNRQLDPSGLPATLSPKVITKILRDSIGFKGVVVSDDMQMYAISKNYGQKHALELCINAGVDLMLVGNNVIATQVQSATKIHAMITELVKEGKISKKRIDESYKRIINLKKHIGILK